MLSQLRGACVKHQSDAMGGARQWRTPFSSSSSNVSEAKGTMPNRDSVTKKIRKTHACMPNRLIPMHVCLQSHPHVIAYVSVVSSPYMCASILISIYVCQHSHLHICVPAFSSPCMCACSLVPMHIHVPVVRASTPSSFCSFSNLQVICSRTKFLAAGIILYMFLYSWDCMQLVSSEVSFIQRCGFNYNIIIQLSYTLRDFLLACWCPQHSTAGYDQGCTGELW